MGFSTKSLRFLIIDDSNPVRTWLRATVANFGVLSIHTASSYYDGLNKLKQHEYDVVLCDYYLSDRRDGQQLLEEVRRAKIIPISTIFFMITGESKYKHVFSAAELAPDDYLLKPITPHLLWNRLEKAFKKRHELNKVYELYDNKRYAECYSLCQRKIQEKSKFSLDLIRIEGDCLLAEGKSSDAFALYQKVLEVQPLPWAKLGLAKALFNQSEFNESTKLLEELIEESPDYMQAKDLLTKGYIETERVDEAANLMKSSMSRNPKALHRHRDAIKIAALTGDGEMHLQAYSLLHEHGRGSSFVTPEDFAAYADVLLAHSGDNAATLIAELKSDLVDSYGTDANAGWAKAMLDFSHARATNNQPEIERQYKRLISNTLDGASALQQEALVKAALVVGDTETAMRIGTQMLNAYCGNAERTTSIMNVLGNGGMKEQAEEAARKISKDMIDINNRAVMMAKGGNLYQAMVDLIDAAAKSGNLIIIINAAKAINAWLKTKGEDSELREKMESFVRLARDRDPENKKLAELESAMGGSVVPS